MNLNQTAILIFALDARDEAPNKKLLGNNQANNNRLINELNKRIRKTVDSTGLPFFHINTKKQTGKNFVSRYKNAIESVFNKGFKRVIVVGNDSPEISSSLLLNVENQLERYDLVYGDTNAGGIYTLGLTKKGFDDFQFNEMSWQTDLLSLEFDLLNEKNQSFYKLPKKLAEFNTEADINHFLLRISKSKTDQLLYAFLFNLSFNKKIPVLKSIEGAEAFFESNLSLRGPPEVLLFQS